MKFLVLVSIFVSIIINFNSCTFINQERLDDNQNIGKKVSFQQPIVFIERKIKSIVPIVANIKKEITGLHTKCESELKNQYITSNTIFTISEAYTYSDILNKPKTYYVLLDKNIKYILSEDTLKRLQKPIYEKANMPTELLDKLYLKKEYSNIKIKFYSSINSEKYHQRISISQFEECKAQDIKNKYNYIVATVNFKQLACLYSELWDSTHSEQNPVKFEVVE